MVLVLEGGPVKGQLNLVQTVALHLFWLLSEHSRTLQPGSGACARARPAERHADVSQGFVHLGLVTVAMSAWEHDTRVDMVG